MKKALLILYVCVASFCNKLHSQDDNNVGLVQDNSELTPGENADEKIKKNFFLRAEVTKSECYVGEPLMAVFKAYSRLDANSQVLRRPSLSGFSVVEMVDGYSNHPEVERYNGENYFVHLIRKVQLFPLQPGKFTIEPAEVESIIHLRRSSGPGLRIRDFFRRKKSDGLLERQMVFETPSLSIQVNPLPLKDQPDDYAGAVGDFIVHLQMVDTVFAAREPNIIKLSISGLGNFPLVTEPHVNWPSSAEISGPTVTEQVNKYAYPLSGVKTYQFSIEHRDTGTFTIPPVQFSYFDPKSKTYKTAKSAELRYTVSPASAAKKKDDQLVFRNENQTSLHYYYFGGVALIIISLIIYLIMKPAKKEK
jgi:hypothetical protein